MKPSEVTQKQWDNEDYFLTPKEGVVGLWDASVKIQGNNLVISGGLVPGGPGEVGSATMTISKATADEYYTVESSEDLY